MAHNYLNILRSVGYPTTCCVIDWETYFDSDYSLAKLSQPEYILDSRFKVLGLAYKTCCPNVEHEARFHAGGLPNEDMAWDGGVTFLAHNMAFEAQILALRYQIYPRYMIDTLGLSRAWCARRKHDLGTLAKDYDLGMKGETAQFKGLTTATPELIAYAKNDVDLEWALFKKLLPLLSRPHVEIPIMQHTTEMLTRPILQINQHKANQLLVDMEGQLAASVETAQSYYL